MKKRVNSRAALLQAVEEQLRKPTPPPADWQAALTHAREFTALLGMEPFVRREEGNVKLREISYTSGMGYRFVLSVDDKEMTRSEAMHLISSETPEVSTEAALEVSTDEEEESHVLYEDELGKVLVALNLTEGWVV